MVAPVNDQLYADLPGNRFITAWFGQLDADGRGLESLSAGQAPLLHYHAADDRLEVLKADVPPLGIFPMLPAARPRRIELAAGDLWVVLSDGFFEANDPAGEQLGVERIGEVLRRCRALRRSRSSPSCAPSSSALPLALRPPTIRRRCCCGASTEA